MTTATTMKLTPQRALQGFRTHVKQWQKASLSLCASAAVVLLANKHAPEGKQVDFDTTLIRLRGEVSAAGDIGQSQVYKVVGLAKDLVERLIKEFKTNGPIVKVLKAETHDDAMSLLLDHLERQKIVTLEGLAVWIGKYQRGGASRGTQAQPPRGKRGAGQQQTAGAGATAAGAGAAPANTGGGVTAPGDARGVQTMLKVMPLGLVCATVAGSGHALGAIAQGLLPYIAEVDDLESLITHAQARIDFLNVQAGRIVSPGIATGAEVQGPQRPTRGRQNAGGGRQRQRVAA